MNINKEKVLRLIDKFLKDEELTRSEQLARFVEAIHNLKPERVANDNNKTALQWIKGEWNTLYQKYTIEPPIVTYGKDIRHISALISGGLTTEQLNGLARKYFEVWKNGNDKFISHNEPSIGIFYSQINKLNGMGVEKPVKEL